MLAIFLVLLGSLLFIKPAYAGEPPIQTSPDNGSVVSSSTLNWQAPSYSLYSTNPYRVQVDDNSSFLSSSINKDYYTKNTYYSPILSEGTWHWRVKAKDSSGIWSEWSSVWSFTLQSIPTPTLTPSPTPSSTPSSSSSSSTATTSFTISNIPQKINSDQSFSVAVNLSLPASPNTTFYLKGAFKKADGSNYFGLTKMAGNWVKNGSSFANQYVIVTDHSGNWSGNLEVQPDSEDAGFTGSDDYIFKVARYTSTGSGPTWSNESIINIVSTGSNDQGGRVSEAVSDNPHSTTISPSTAPAVKSKTTVSSQSKNYDREVYHTASVVATIASANPSPIAEVKSQKRINYFSWAGVLMIVSGTSVLAFVYLRSRNLPHAISNLFRKRN